MKKPSHPYIPNSSPTTRQEMMREIGVRDIEELYKDIPEKFRLKESLHFPEKPLSELEVKKTVENLFSRNKPSDDLVSFLGAGCWPHYVPAVVPEILKRSEFLTSYTPYQPEISQGMLQALFEYQSMICALTNMGVANCSMYDWASALGEAGRMAARITRRNEILIPKLTHPERALTLKLYTETADIDLRQIAYDDETGQTILEDIERKISDKTAAVYVENPSYLGFIETGVDEIGEEAHKHGALFIVGVDPTSLGILKPPGEYGADIVVGESQPLGSEMNFGGPLLGIMACRNDLTLVRQMPGRIIGLTKIKNDGRKGFCMALQTREQHIRREKATSNICTNEALCAVASAVYMASLGNEGLRKLGETIFYKSNYAKNLLSRIGILKTPVFKSAHFKEFTVNFDETGRTVKEVNKMLLTHGIQGGKDLSTDFPELGQTALYCVTEIHSKEEIERLSHVMRRVLNEQ